MNDKTSIRVNDVSKLYSLYGKPADRLKEVLLFSKKSYHSDYYALDKVSFDVKKGETFGIIGTNGAGKSTLLKLITGVARPTSGDIMINGKISALLELGAGFNVEYTGIQNIYLNGTMMGFKREEMESKVQQIMEFADIGDFIYQPVKTYSSGMFARLAFSVAINVEPEILIVDEALSVGDVFFQNKCYRKFEELRNKGITVIFVSHDIASIKQMCSRVLWLEKGQIWGLGNAKEVCEAYSTARMQDTNEYNEKNIYNLEKEIETVKDSVVEEKVINYEVPAIRSGVDGIFSDKAEILSVFVTDKTGAISEEVQTDIEYSLNIVSRFNECLNNVIIGFSVESIKGLSIIGDNTYANCKETYNVQVGDQMITSFKFTFPKIETGNYLISPAIAIGTQEVPVIITWLNSAGQIHVKRPGYNIALINADCAVESKIVKSIELF